MSNIESSVTRLLVATKQLIETLTTWSKKGASETDVSDVYVRLGNEFNIARTCFERAGIEMRFVPQTRDGADDCSDLTDIPSQLRGVLETCLARDASPRVLEIYLPKVREIVINLLQGLKRKQARYRARAHASTTSTTTEDDPRKSLPLKQPQPQQRTSLEKTPSDSERRRSPSRRPVGARDESPKPRDSPQFPAPPSPRQLVQPPTTTATTPPTTTNNATLTQDRPTITTVPATPTFPRPSSPERVPPNEALQKLQISDALQRRASKRYSAYNFAKLDVDAESSVGGPRPPVPTRRSGSYSPNYNGPPSQIVRPHDVVPRLGASPSTPLSRKKMKRQQVPPHIE